MSCIQIAGRDITYTVSYKRRKTIQIKIISENSLAVTAPLKIPRPEIERILFSKSSWIIQKIHQYQQLVENPVNKSISHGATLLYQGFPHILIFENAEVHTPVVLLESGTIRLLHRAQQINLIPELLKTWYKQQAATLLAEHTAEWSRKTGLKPKHIVIKEQKTRWGSCSSLGNINFNWRIIMAPSDVMDYLIVHELCHLKVPNHSHDFWKLVAFFLPNFKDSRDWLKRNGGLLFKTM